MYNICIMGILEGEEGEKGRGIIWSNNDGVFHQINVRVQTTDPGSLENTRQGKFPKLHLGIS